jgi:transposase
MTPPSGGITQAGAQAQSAGRGEAAFLIHCVVDHGRCGKPLFWLLDEVWAAIEPHLPENQPGARRVDDRRVISSILHVLKVGCRWCDCPAEYGPSTTVYNRFNRWSHRGFWLKLLDALVGAGAVTKRTAVDSTFVAKGGARRKRSTARVVAGRPRSTRSPTSSAVPMR